MLLQLRLNYPSNLLSIASESSCQTGADWPASSLTFVCNARGSANSVLFNSILQPPFASQLGSAVRVATITFKATAVGSGALTVDILGLAQYGGASRQSVSAVASAGTVSCKLQLYQADLTSTNVWTFETQMHTQSRFVAFAEQMRMCAHSNKYTADGMLKQLSTPGTVFASACSFFHYQHAAFIKIRLFNKALRVLPCHLCN